MEISQVIIGAVLLILVLMVLGTPIGFVFVIVGLLGGLLMMGGRVTSLLGFQVYGTSTSYNLSAVPLFVLMGLLAGEFGLTKEIYNSAYRWLVKVPGALAAATVAGCAGFAFLTGSAVAGSATMGVMAWPEMRRYGYSPRLALGTIAAAGTLGILIPPSLGMLAYGLITDESIGKLFIAGLIPGILVAIIYIISIILRCKLNPKLARLVAHESFTWSEKFASLKNLYWLIIIVILVLGGLYGGFLTPTEGGAVGAFGVFIIGLAKKKLSKKGIVSSLEGTAKVTGLVFLIIAGVTFFNSFVAQTGIATFIGSWVSGLHLNRYIILAFILLIYFPLGCFIDALGMMVLTLPFVYPIVIDLGFSGILFGVLMMRMCEVANITPPLALNIFTLKAVAPEVDIRDIYLGAFPYVGVDCLILVILVAFPQISLFLPNLMR